MAILSPFIRYSLLALGLAGAATAVPAQAPSLAMLDRLEKGSWQLRERGKDAVVQTICVGDARRMIQVYHPGATCSRYVIEDPQSAVTVHYTCPGAGHGRKTIRRETHRKIGRESCRGTGGEYGLITGVAVPVKKKQKQ